MKKLMRIAAVLVGTKFLLLGVAFPQISPYFSSKLLVHKLLTPGYHRMNSQNSNFEFGYDIFGTPYGVSSLVYQDGPYTQWVETEFLTVSDVGWDRLILYGMKGWTTDDDKRFIEARGRAGAQAAAFNFNGPRHLTGYIREDDGFVQILVSDTYNHRVHLYAFFIGNPQGVDLAGFYNSVADGIPLNTPCGIDNVRFLYPFNQPGGKVVRNFAVADYGNDRVVIFRLAINRVGQAYPPAGETGYRFDRPTAAAYAWDKATGFQTNDLFVVSSGDGKIYCLSMDYPNTNAYPTVLGVTSFDFNRLVAQGLALPNYFLSSATVDNHGLLWVLDSHNGMVYKFWKHFDPIIHHDTLELIGSWGGYGTADGQLNRPNAITAQHGFWKEGCGTLCGIAHPLWNLNDILITETWGPITGVRRFGIGIEVFADSAKYTAKTNSGGGNYVDYFYRLTGYAAVTEKVYSPTGALVATLRSNEGQNPGPNHFVGNNRWGVGTNGNGPYRIEITAVSPFYGGATDIKNLTVAVDTSKRNNPPVVVAGYPRYAGDPAPACFFPTNYSTNRFGGAWVKGKGSDPDPEVLTYIWESDSGWVGPHPFITVQRRYDTPADSVFVHFFYGAPAPSSAGASNPEEVPGCKSKCLFLTVTDPPGNLSQQENLAILGPCRRGDMNADAYLTSSDLVLELNAVFLGQAPPPYGDYVAIGDVNCDGILTSADVVLLLNMALLETSPPC